MVKVSVVVPIYNTEKYIERCLNSLVSQTLHDIEIICVDDGSSDNSALIVEEFIKKDNRIKLIKQKNLKQGAARNNGTKEAVGEYIGFVDSDDWVDIDYYQKLYEAAKKYDADIALAVNVRIGNGITKKRLNLKEEKIAYTLQEKIDLSNQAKNPCPTNKIYKKELLINNNITFSEGCFCEDKLFTIKALYYSNKMISVPGIYYYYFRNPSSTVNTKTNKHLLDKNNARKAVLDFLKEKNAKIEDRGFSAIKKDYRVLNLLIWRIKETLKSEIYYLFGYIKVLRKEIR